MEICPLLDDLFAWAAQQPEGNTSRVDCNLVTNQSTWHGQDKNLAGYAEGSLEYHPGGWHKLGKNPVFVLPSFAGSLTQYFSDRRYRDPGSQGFSDFPFDAHNTDPLNLSISAAAFGTGLYSVSIHSPKWGFTQSFTPKCEAGIIYGAVDNVELVVVSLCQRSSQEPIH